MEKYFIFLYPIKEFFSSLNSSEESLNILNSALIKRYKEKGYKIVCVTYPDKEIYGINENIIDYIIKTNITFNEHITPDENENYKYPSEEVILKSFIDNSKIIVGGFHFGDCVKRFGEKAINLGFDCLVDLDLTDLFFNLYNTEYFDIDNYDPNKFKGFMLNKMSRYGDEVATKIFERNYSSSAYGMFNKSIQSNLKK